MRTPGFIYVLENPAIPNCVKIGKTVNDPLTRAGQLSSATGVPLPFSVSYEAFFKDCDMAEMYVHALLEARSMRMTANREFFSVSLSEAIAAVKQAEVKFSDQNTRNSDNDYQSEFSDPLLSELSIDDTENALERGAEPWEEILGEAHNYDHGTDDILEDKTKAVSKYKIAAKLGSAEAYIRLAEIYADEYGDKKKGIDWLKQGADRNLWKCWVELGNVFSGQNIFFGDDVVNVENAIKCYRKYLNYDFYEISDFYEDRPYAVLKMYLALVTKDSQYFRKEEVKVFVEKLRDWIRRIGNQEEEVNAKMNDMRVLLEHNEMTKTLSNIL